MAVVVFLAFKVAARTEAYSQAALISTGQPHINIIKYQLVMILMLSN